MVSMPCRRGLPWWPWVQCAPPACSRTGVTTSVAGSSEKAALAVPSSFLQPPETCVSLSRPQWWHTSTLAQGQPAAAATSHCHHWQVASHSGYAPHQDRQLASDWGVGWTWKAVDCNIRAAAEPAAAAQQLLHSSSCSLGSWWSWVWSRLGSDCRLRSGGRQLCYCVASHAVWHHEHCCRPSVWRIACLGTYTTQHSAQISKNVTTYKAVNSMHTRHKLDQHFTPTCNKN